MPKGQQSYVCTFNGVFLFLLVFLSRKKKTENILQNIIHRYETILMYALRSMTSVNCAVSPQISEFIQEFPQMFRNWAHHPIIVFVYVSVENIKGYTELYTNHCMRCCAFVHIFQTYFACRHYIGRSTHEFQIMYTYIHMHRYTSQHCVLKKQTRIFPHYLRPRSVLWYDPCHDPFSVIFAGFQNGCLCYTHNAYNSSNTIKNSSQNNCLNRVYVQNIKTRSVNIGNEK